MIDKTFYKNKGPFTLARIAEITGAVLTDESKAEEKVSEIATMEKAGADDICFFYETRQRR